MIQVGEDTWTNYRVQFTVVSWGCHGGNDLIVGVRAKSKSNMVALRGSSCGMGWNKVTSSGYEIYGSNIPNVGSGTNDLILVTVQGNQFQLEGQENPVTVMGYPQGKVIIQITYGIVITDFKVIKLP